ncbi:uncharacterized protein LOC118915261 isoform X2 [Manis pentadactyla]|uniref:uncharacterized protein LOC118915261 isoform X2 n=1 Tax=Manis pentadactyla TaxID=143292 RepID=UPI00255D08DC|nr:uncharacterized protein LOC118915261 isoform X2 [Manis pentadactyla]
MCAKWGGPARVPGVWGAAPSPPVPRSRPLEGPLSRSLTPSPAPPLPLPQRRPTQELARLSSDPRAPGHPRRRAPAHRGKLSPRGRAWGAENPLPARPGAFPGAAVTRGRAPPLLPPPRPPRTRNCGCGSDPGPESLPPVRLWSPPLRPQSPHPGNGVVGVSTAETPCFQPDPSCLRVLARTGLALNSPYPFPLHPLRLHHARVQRAPSARPLPCSLLSPMILRWWAKEMGTLKGSGWTAPVHRGLARVPPAPPRAHHRVSSPDRREGFASAAVCPSAWSSSEQDHPVPLIPLAFIEHPPCASAAVNRIPRGIELFLLLRETLNFPPWGPRESTESSSQPPLDSGSPRGPKQSAPPHLPEALANEGQMPGA